MSKSTSRYISYMMVRILLCLIKHLEKCLCPRCLIVKDKVHELRTKPDMRCREPQAHVDFVNQQNNVMMAQDWISNQGYPVDGKVINDLLGTHLLTPNCIGCAYCSICLNINPGP